MLIVLLITILRGNSYTRVYLFRGEYVADEMLVYINYKINLISNAVFDKNGISTYLK